jgi:hypothetical protein
MMFSMFQLHTLKKQLTLRDITRKVEFLLSNNYELKLLHDLHNLKPSKEFCNAYK